MASIRTLPALSKLVLSATVVTLVSAVSTAALPPALQKGGQDGGGGNNRKAEIVIPNDLGGLPFYATMDLHTVFSYLGNRALLQGPNQTEAPGFDKLFPKQGETALDVVRALDGITKIQEQPCINPNPGPGEPNAGDASSSGKGTKGSVCLSVGEIRKDELRSEWQQYTLALMAHEVAHLMGLSHDEAVVIQDLAKDVIDSLETSKFRSVYFTTTTMRKTVIEPLQLALDELKSSNSERSLMKACKLVSNADLDLVVRLNDSANIGILSTQGVFLNRDFERIQYLAHKVTMLNGACVSHLLDPSEVRNAQSSKNYSDNFFDGRKYATYEDFKEWQNYELEGPRLPEIKAIRASSMKDVKAFRAELSDIVSVLRPLVNKYDPTTSAPPTRMQD
ncbi:MAG: hypothetical protein V4692_05385 [Bdellovibrionota bacterium]